MEWISRAKLDRALTESDRKLKCRWYQPAPPPAPPAEPSVGAGGASGAGGAGGAGGNVGESVQGVEGSAEGGSGDAPGTDLYNTPGATPATGAEGAHATAHTFHRTLGPEGLYGCFTAGMMTIVWPQGVPKPPPVPVVPELPPVMVLVEPPPTTVHAVSDLQVRAMRSTVRHALHHTLRVRVSVIRGSHD